MQINLIWAAPLNSVSGRAATCADWAMAVAPFVVGHVIGRLHMIMKGLQPDPSQQDLPRLSARAGEPSGGGLLAEVPRTVHDCPDHEDNLVLDLAAEVGAMLIVSNDTDLLSMSAWRGTPILIPAAFAAKVDAMRRHARRMRR